MEPSWIILSVTGAVVLIMMIYIFRLNRKDKKTYEKDLNSLSNIFDEESKSNDSD
jgi:preprotein translocase subunit YajC